MQAFLADLKRAGMGQRTVNHYLAAVKQFTRWLVTDRRTNDNHLAYLKGGSAKLDVRRERRELTSEEIRRLLATAQSCRRKGFKLTGWQRFTLYATAIGTGLRASELASLTRSHFDLGADPPTVRIDAADEKSRRGDVIPLPADLVTLLHPWLVGTAPDVLMWLGTWADNKRAGKFMQSDLKAARKAWISEAADSAEQKVRERPDFLRYRDSQRRFADFHALRHTYLSRLGRSGANPKAMQKLARHTTVELTLGKYTHANLDDLAAAIDALPPLPLGAGDNSGQPLVVATGAGEDAPEPPRSESARWPHHWPQLAPNWHLPIVRECHASSAMGQKQPTSRKRKSQGRQSEKPLPQQGFDSDCPSVSAAGHGEREWMGIETIALMCHSNAPCEHRQNRAVQNPVQWPRCSPFPPIQT